LSSVEQGGPETQRVGWSLGGHGHAQSAHEWGDVGEYPGKPGAGQHVCKMSRRCSL